MTELDICNAALQRLGVRLVTSLDEGSVESKICSARLDFCKRSVLRVHPWKCASDRKQLSPVTIKVGALTVGTTYIIGGNTDLDVTSVGAPNNDVGTRFVATDTNPTWGTGFLYVCPAFDWTYQFTLPTDCLRVLSVDDGYTSFQLEGRTILANEFPINLRFVKNLSDYSLVDQGFADALTTYLAWDMCYKLTQSNELKQELWGTYRQMLGIARFVDATEQSAEVVEPQVWLQSRTGPAIGPSGGNVRDPGTY